MVLHAVERPPTGPLQEYRLTGSVAVPAADSRQTRRFTRVVASGGPFDRKTRRPPSRANPPRGAEATAAAGSSFLLGRYASIPSHVARLPKHPVPLDRHTH